MDQIPTWLTAAVAAAGMAFVYNDADWDRADTHGAKSSEPQFLPPFAN